LVATRTCDQRDGIVGPGGLPRFGDRYPALADAQIERRVNLGVVKLHQHVGAANADLGGPERDEGRDVERPHAHHVQHRVVGFEAQPAAVVVLIVGRRDDAGARQQRSAFRQDAALWQGEDQRLVGLELERGRGEMRRS
jgi:hypothetical protein